MQTLTPVSPKPADTFIEATTALKRLNQLGSRLGEALKLLPTPDDALLDTAADEASIARLLSQLDDYWHAAVAAGDSRHDQFLSAMQQALRDEFCVKLHEGELSAVHAGCLPVSALSPTETRAPDAFSLHIQLDEEIQAEVSGAMVLSQAQGPTLLVLPGLGIKAFATQEQMREALTQWLNSPVLKGALIQSLEQDHQDRSALIDSDPDLYAEPFLAIDVQLHAITTEPVAHALKRLQEKQRVNVRYACTRSGIDDREARRLLIQQAIDQKGLFGPQAMLELREMALRESRYQRSLQDWIKLASPRDMSAYIERLEHYEQARAATLSALGTAASAKQFARAHLQARLADDLGYALDPALTSVSTQRTLPVTGETYTVTRSWVELALYGLHPGDRLQTSAFLNRTTLSHDGMPLASDYKHLDATYIARVVEELDLRVRFGTHQKAAYQNPHNQSLMRTLTRAQINALACAAKMQGHIRPEDFAIVEAISHAKPDPALSTRHIRLNAKNAMSKLLVFRKQNAQGELERLVMFIQDAPDQQFFRAFDNEIQLAHELVGWTASDEHRDYLLQQIDVSARPELETQLAALRLKPHPDEDFVQLIALPDYDAGLEFFANGHIEVALSEQDLHTPRWYVNASLDKRQELVALEDAATGAQRNYEAKPHTRVQPFELYVHQQASQQINTLLGVPEGTVDPDLIVITSERETVTYTQLLRNGYDDSVNPLLATADTMATFKGPEGVDLSVLSPASVAGSVRGNWVADRYIAEVRLTLLNPQDEGYDYRRKASALTTQLQMKAAALRSYLKGHIDGIQYAWLKSSLDRAHSSDAATREQYPLYPLQLHIDKPFIASNLKVVDQLVFPDSLLTHTETVQGCVAVLSTQTRQTALLYTPQAPDGIEFRLFSSFMPSLDTPGMIDYYKDRCRFNARRLLSFFLRDMQQGGANKAPFLPKAFITDFADTCFNQTVERRLLDTEQTTTGRNDMLSKMAWVSVELIATALTLPFPPASFAVGSLLSLHDSVRAVQALTDGDHETAGAHVISALLNSLGAAGDLHSGLKGFGGIVHQLERGAPMRSVHSVSPANSMDSVTSALRPLSRQSSLPRYEDLFPVDLQEKTVWVGKKNANGHAPLYQQIDTSSSQVGTTGQFVGRRSGETWLPLSSPLNAKPDLAIDLSLHNVARIKDGHAKGVCLVDGKYCIGMSGKTYVVQFDAGLRCWQIIDPDTPFAFFGKQPVRLDSRGQWQKIDRHQLRGGGLEDQATWRPLQEEGVESGDAVVRSSDYEMPVAMRPGIYTIMHRNIPDPTNMGLELYFESYFASMRQTLAALQDKLYHDAKTFFTKPVLPARPTVPTLPSRADVDTLVENIFNHSNGLVISEAAQSVASKRLLILNMPLLAERKVEVLYIQHLFTDKHLEKLATYRQLAARSRSGSHELKRHLKYLNNGALNNHASEYDYYHLIKEAHKHGIEVRPFSSLASYPLIENPVAAAADDLSAAQKMSNFFGHTLISEDVARQPSRRWVALLDQKLATTHDSIPGITELQGAISVHVQDVPAGRATRVRKNSFPPAAESSADFTVEFCNPLVPASVPPLQPGTQLDAVLMNRMVDRESIESAERWAGDYVFRWDADKGWLRGDPEGRPGSATAIQQSLADATYDAPAEHRDVLHKLANFEYRGLDERYFLLDPELTDAREDFFRLRKQLLRDSEAVHTTELPVRPLLPQVPADISPADFLERLYQHTSGVVVGESHASVASKKLIIDNLPTLAEQNVKTLYLEHLLSDLHQADLDDFLDTGQMSKRLLHDLQALDKGHQTDPKGIYTFEKLVIKAQQQGIEIRAIDCLASYHLKGLANETSTTRQQMMNFFASRTVRRHQDVMGFHKWIALVGNSHSNTFMDAVPGLAELEGGIGLRVKDVLPGASHGIVRDPGEALPLDLGKAKVHIQGDYRVEIEVPRSRPVTRPRSIEKRLAKPGMFLIEQNADGLQIIVHRSRDSQIYRTPVNTDAQGKLSVDRPSWVPVHLKAFDDMNALTVALRDMNLSRVE
ncbi:membrane-targeted effector domain-containing toxin [Pseudomonas viridiflava]|uniref:membrane-targeted effector domain-containing toxin n=1 Tax=Pseudomonas viridiflava TaxID=33069 RepID=UPI000F02391B|nr:membrane-targeted effector domain-containing toxin [Pseudomonas viridiflava]